MSRSRPSIKLKPSAPSVREEFEVATLDLVLVQFVLGGFVEHIAVYLRCER